MRREIPYVGESIDMSVYRVVFPPIDIVADDKDQIIDRVMHSEFDGQTLPDPTITKIESAVPPETHPYICTTCGKYVTQDCTGKCEGCGNMTWKMRETNHKE